MATSVGTPVAALPVLAVAKAEEVVAELRWVIECAEDHLGTERAGRYLRKFYSWYADTLGLSRRAREPLVTAPTTEAARAELDRLAVPAAA